jgi:hypothetical protein
VIGAVSVGVGDTVGVSVSVGATVAVAVAVDAPEGVGEATAGVVDAVGLAVAVDVAAATVAVGVDRVEEPSSPPSHPRRPIDRTSIATSRGAHRTEPGATF